MKTCLAAVIATLVLWLIDAQFFNGRYAYATHVVFNRTLSAMMPK